MAEQEHIDDPALDQIVLRYFPRAEEHECALKTWKSTSELFLILDEHMPGRWSAEQLGQYLHQQGYERKLIGEELRWALATVR